MKYLFLLSVIFFVPDVYGWEFGGFVPDDVYVYDICDYQTINRDISRLHLCYTLQLSILDTGISGSNTVWIAQTIITNSNSVGSTVSRDYTQSIMGDIILIDDTTYEIRSLSSRYAADTLSNTLFWIYHDARISSIDPRLGSDVYTSHLYSPVIIDEYTEYSDNSEFRVYFDGELISGHLQLQDDIGLPVSGAIYTPQIVQDRELFTFDLVSITRGTDISDIPILDDTSISSIFSDIPDDNGNNNDIAGDITDTIDETDVDVVSLVPKDTPDNNTLNIPNNPISDVPLDMIPLDESSISSETLLGNTTDTMNDVIVPLNTSLVADAILDTLNIASQISDTQNDQSAVEIEPDLVESITGLIQDFVSDIQNAFESVLVS